MGEAHHRGMGPIADKLLTDVQTLEARTRTLAYQPDELANGANGLLDEVASSKITGEEDRYSHTDLSDFLANVTGSQTTFGLLAPALKAKDPKLETDIAARFDAVQDELKTLDANGNSRATTPSTTRSASGSAISCKPLRSRWRGSRTRSAHDRGAARRRSRCSRWPARRGPHGGRRGGGDAR